MWFTYTPRVETGLIKPGFKRNRPLRTGLEWVDEESRERADLI